MNIDVRVVAATNRDPHAAVAEGKLRERHNREAGVQKRLTPAAGERLLAHDWPGNVRELAHAIERAFILAENEIGPECFSIGAAVPIVTKGDALSIQVGTSIAEAQRLLTLATDDHFREKKKTAEVLGISLKTLYTWFKSYPANESATRAMPVDAPFSTIRSPLARIVISDALRR